MYISQTFETKDYAKVYFADNNDNIKKVVIICKAKDLKKAVN